MGDRNPKPGPPSPDSGREELIPSPIGVIDHVGSAQSYTLQVATDRRSFTVEWRDGSTRTVSMAGPGLIKQICPSVEGTIVVCMMTDHANLIFDVRDGHQITTKEELNQLKQHIYG